MRLRTPRPSQATRDQGSALVIAMAFVLIGALMVTTIRNGLNILGVNAFWQYVVNGIVIIAAVAVDQYRRRR